MKLFSIVLSILLCTSCSIGQNLSKSDDKKMKEVIALRKAGDLEKAEKNLLKLLEKYPEEQELYLEKGVLHSEQKNIPAAIEAFQTAWDFNPKASHRLTYTLASLYLQEEEYEKALEMVEHFQKFDNIREAQKKSAQRLKSQIYFTQDAKAHPVEIELERLSPNINSENSEYLPAFTADGETLIFTRRTNRQEDFYLSQKTDSVFSEAIPLADLNTGNNEGAHCLSPDGNYLFFTGCHMKDSQGGCDLYITTKKEGSWIAPINLGPTVNSGKWDAQPSLSPDGKRLYFASERNGGMGKSDIWYVNIENGKWSEPINAGPAINTTEDEASPFIHLDGQTLYFRSNGHVGMGDYDLFLSRWTDNEWGEIKNLGYPINNSGSEGALSVSPNGEYAYFASDADTDNLDIYRFKLPEDLRPKAVSYFKALVLDSETEEPISAKIEVFNITTDKMFFSSTTNEEGTVLSSILMENDYLIHVSAPGYNFYSENIPKAMSSSDDPTTITIKLEKLVDEEVLVKESEPVILKNIFFTSGSADLLQTSSFEISKLAKILNDTPDYSIRIMGHTDNVGSETDNQKLSLARAESVKSALISQGIAAERIIAKGMGETMPITTNDTEEGRQQNRRTEFVLISK